MISVELDLSSAVYTIKTPIMKLVSIFLCVVFLSFCFAQNGQWTEEAEACIRQHNDWIGTATSFTDCQKSCEDQTSFTCLSIDYKDRRCQHSRFNRQSVRPVEDFTQPCYNGQPWHYAERLDVDYGWTDVVLGCIRRNNDWDGPASDITECQKLCEEETSFVCLSIDFSNGNCHLSRFNRESIRPTSDYTQPCYVGGWQYSERRNIRYGWTDVVLGCIRLNNDWDGTASDIAECQKLCEEETSFVCLSIDFSNENCHLSRFNRESIRPTSDYTQPCYVGGWQYSERRNIKYFWSETVLGCIRGNNDWAGSTSSLKECQKRCEDERDFTCLSVDYKDSSCHLSRFSRNTIQPNSDFTQPCYVDGWYYAERVNIVRNEYWTREVYACIRNHNIRSIRVPDLDSCRLICSQEDGCCSIDYRNGQCNLSPNTRTNVVPSSDYTEPCYISGWQYSERLDELCI